MSIFTLKSPTGNIYTLKAPENTDEEELKQYVANMERETLARQENNLPPNRKYAMPSMSTEHLKTKKEYQALPVPMLDKIAAGVAAGTTHEENFATNLMAEFPVMAHMVTVGHKDFGTQFVTPQERFGEDFYELSPELRRDRIHQMRKKELEEAYPEVYANGHQASGSFMAGKVIGSLLTPTTLLPVGQTKTAAFGIGALLGSSYSYLDQTAQGQDVSWGNVAVSGAIGGAGGLGARWLGIKASEGIKSIKVAAYRASPKGVAEAHARTLEVNKTIEELMMKGVNEIELERLVTERVGRSSKEIITDSKVGDLPLTRPTESEIKLFNGMPEEGITPVFRATNAAIDNIVGSLSSAVGRISPKMGLRLRELDSVSLRTVFDRQGQVTAFGNFWGGQSWKNPIGKIAGGFRTTLSDADRELAKYSIINGNFEDVRKIFSRYGEDKVELFEQALKVNRDIFEDLKTSGVKDIGHRKNYWHRSIKDYDGLLAALPSKTREAFQKAQDNYVAKLRKEGKLQNDEPLTPVQKEDFMNDFLRGRIRRKEIRGKPLSAGKERKFERVPQELMRFYDDPMVAMMKYIDEATYSAARKRFFSSLGSKTEDTTKQSIGNIAKNLLENNEINFKQLEELKSLLEIRFINGEMALGGISQGFRQLGYMATLANPFSAIIQLGDIGSSVYRNGMLNTVAGMLDIPLGQAATTMRKMGLDRVMSEEFRDERFLAKGLHTLFTVSGFRLVDRLGKDVFLQSAYRKFTNAALNPKSKVRKKMDAKYKNSFGEEYDALLGDLSNGTVSERVKLLLWSELADVQPISLSEMPIQYLKNPGTRLLYMLKTYTAKQLDLMSRDIRDEWRSGSKVDAVKNAFRYGLIVPTGNAGIQGAKDFMLQKEVSVDDFPDYYVDAFFKTWGASEYILNNYSKHGDVSRLAADTLMPPIDWFVDTFNTFYKEVSGDNPDWNKAIRHAPVMGRYYYWFHGNGLDDYRDKMWKEKNIRYTGRKIEYDKKVSGFR